MAFSRGNETSGAPISRDSASARFSHLAANLSEPTEGFALPKVGSAATLELAGKPLHGERWVAARPRELPHVDQLGDAVILQQLDELVEASPRVADRKQ